MRCTIDDEREVRDILEHPDVWGTFVEEGTPDYLKKFLPKVWLANPMNIVLMPTEDSVFFSSKRSNIAIDGHVACLPSCRGGNAVKAAMEAINWIWGNTKTERIFVSPYSYNPQASILAGRLGFKKECTIPKTVKKDGRYYDTIVYSLERRR